MRYCTSQYFNKSCLSNMTTCKSKVIHSASSVIAVLFIVHVAFAAAEPISYDDFLQSLADAVASDNEDSSTLLVSKLPQEILNFMKEELYDSRVLKNFATTSKDELTKILINDVISRKTHFEDNMEVYESFVTNVLTKDIGNYPNEESGENPNDIMFLSKMTMEDVNKIIEATIIDKGVTLKESWKVLTLKDSFWTVYFYCKYPKEMKAVLTEEMREEVRLWLDSTPTWGTWGFSNDASINIAKVEL